MVDGTTSDGPAGSSRSGPLSILIATAVGGGAGYLLTILVGVRLGAEGYAPFAIFWSTLYLVIGALTGIQQEVARAARVKTDLRGQPIARNFAVVGSLSAGFLAVASAPLWQPVIFQGDGWSLVWPLAFGFASYFITAVTGGVLYGINVWSLIAVMIAADGLLRLILTAFVLTFTQDIAVLGWAVVLPFLLVPLGLWVFWRNQVVGRFELDVGYRALIANVLRTLPGSLATGVLVSGLPALLGATSPQVAPAALAALAFSINLARAPLVIVVLSLQSYFIVTFQKSVSLLRSLFLLLLLTAAAAIALGSAAALVGPAVLGAVFGAEFVVDGPVLGYVVASGGMVGMICITGAAVLAQSRHFLYSGGWVIAAATTFAFLLLPLDFSLRAVLALLIGPAAGLVVHLGGLLSRQARN